MATATAPTQPAGRYPSGTAGVARDWDGHAWAWQAVRDPGAAAFPHWKHRPWAILGHRLFWLWLGSALIAAALSFAYVRTGNRAWSMAAAVIGCSGAMAAFVLFVDHRVHFSHVVGWRTFILWGLLGGLAAIGASYLLEGTMPSPELNAASAGPFEESTKVLLPVILYLLGRYRDPRAGFAIALACGAVFGVAEGFEYVGLDARQILQEGAVHHHPHSDQEVTETMVVIFAAYRPLVELMHPLLVGFTAAIAWRWAWVRHHFWAPLLVALVIAAAFHSAIDLSVASQIWGWKLVAVCITASVFFALTRPAARQLPSPEAITHNPPSWRPRVPRALKHAEHVTAERPADPPAP